MNTPTSHQSILILSKPTHLLTMTIAPKTRNTLGRIMAGLITCLTLTAPALADSFDVPDIVVEQPAGTNIVDGGSAAFGAVAAGSTADLVFTVRNAGTVDLTGLGITFDGYDPEMFSVVSAPTAPVVPGGSTTFTVRFAPTNGGGHSAGMHITSNDFDETPFDITLTDTAAASANTKLTNLTLSSGSLTPAFSPTTTSYTASVPYSLTSLTVTPTKLHANASIKVNGTTVASGSASGAIALAVGPNVINTVVTAQDGTTTQTYAVTVTRASAATGDVDVAFNPNSDNTIFTAVPQADGKILLGGYFAYLGGNYTGIMVWRD